MPRAVALGPGSADPFSPKAVRASMGAIFSVPVARAGDVGALPGTTIALVAGAGQPLSSGDWLMRGSARDATANPSDVTLLVGSERDGLPEALVTTADVIAHIPIQTHSLNAAMAATVALYELTRMRPAQ